MIDDWKPENILFVLVDNIVTYQFSPVASDYELNGNVSLCGLPEKIDAVRYVDIVFPHTAGCFEFRLKTDLKKFNHQRSWGYRDLTFSTFKNNKKFFLYND